MRRPVDIAREYLKNSNPTGAQLSYVYEHRAQFWWYERPRVLEMLVRNPNCPPEIYTTLFPQLTTHALANPAWSLLVTEGQFLHSLDRIFVANCLRDETTPKALLEALTSHPVGWMASAARQHVALVGEASVGWGQELLTDFATRLWRDSSLVWAMRAGALPDAINRRLPYPIQPQPLLPERERQEVLEKIAGQRGTSLATVLAIAHMKSPNPALGEHARWERRLALALNRNASSAKKKLRLDGHVWVRAAARQDKETI